MSTERPLVLVVEDDADLRELLTAILALLEIDVATAANGLEALVVLEHVCPALILLDMRMPVMDGWEFARELDRRGPRPPIVVITAAPDPALPAAEIGAEGWLGKPFDLRDLTRVIERFMGDLQTGAPLH
jgi:CheY-like chemotaxis protein